MEDVPASLTNNEQLDWQAEQGRLDFSGAVIGAPWQKHKTTGHETFVVPEQPHVFRSAVTVIDADGTQTKIPGSPTSIVGHGERNDKGEWVFADGQSIKSVVEDWNQYHPDQPIDLILACNPNGDGVELESINAWHATNSNIHISGMRTEDGNTVLQVRLPEGAKVSDPAPRAREETIPKSVSFKDQARGYEPQATAESFDEAIDTTSPQSFMRSSVDYLRAHPEELAEGRYTEVHVVDGAPLIAISPRPMLPYGATVGGHHSLIDEMRGYNEHHKFPNFMKATAMLGDEANEVFATHDSLRAKGVVYRDGEALNMVLQDIRRDSNGVLKSVQEVASQAGIDRVLIKELYGKADQEPIDLSKTNKYIEVRADYSKIGEAETGMPQNPDVMSGIVTNAEVGDATMSLSGTNPTVRTGISLSMLESNIPRHAELYKYAEMQDDHGYIDFKMGEQTVRMGIRYGSDTYKGKTEQTVNLFYDREYGQDVLPLQHAVLKEIINSGFYGSAEDAVTSVTVSYPDSDGRAVVTRHKVGNNGKPLNER